MPPLNDEHDDQCSTALLVVDLQNDFCEGGALECPGARDLADKIPKLAQQYQLVISTQDYHINPGDHFQKWPPHCVQDTYGAQLCPELADIKWSAGIRKGQFSAGYSAFDGIVIDNPHTSSTDAQEISSDVAQWLHDQGVTQIDIAGVALDYCVLSSALDAASHGFTTNIVINYTVATNKEVYDFLCTTVAHQLLKKSDVGVIFINNDDKNSCEKP